MTAYASSHAKKIFPNLCREVSDSGVRVYIRDGAKRPAVTITTETYDDAISVSGQFFKDNYSRCVAMIKAGMIFRVTAKNANPVYVRRHEKYSDPVDILVSRWLANLQRQAVEDELQAISRKIDNKTISRDEFSDHVQALRKGIDRVAAGHLPFREGQIPDAMS